MSPGREVDFALIGLGLAVIGVGLATWLSATLDSVHRWQRDRWTRHMAAHRRTAADRLSTDGCLRCTQRLACPTTGCTGRARRQRSSSRLPPALLSSGAGGTSTARAKNVADSDKRPRARPATPADIGPLVVDDVVPPTGRMLLGRLADHRHLLAAGAATVTHSRARRHGVKATEVRSRSSVRPVRARLLWQPRRGSRRGTALSLPSR